MLKLDILKAVCETLLLGMSANAFVRCQRQQHATQNLFSFVQKADVLSPATAAYFLSFAKDNFSGDFKNIIQGKNFVKGIGILEGVVHTGNPMKSVMDYTTDLILSQVSMQKLLNSSGETDSSNESVDVLKVNEFTLKDMETKDYGAQVDTSSKLNFYHDALNLIRSEERYKGLTQLEKFINWLMFSVRLFLSITNFGKRSSSISRGTRRVENGILVGQVLTILGEFVYDRYNNSLRVTNPIYLMKNKEQLVKYLQNTNTRQGRNLSLLLAITAFCFGRLIRRSMKILTRLHGIYLGELKKHAGDKFDKMRSLYTSGYLCMQCKTNPRCVIFKPCLHLSICRTCDAKRASSSCPECNSDVVSSIHIYTA